MNDYKRLSETDKQDREKFHKNLIEKELRYMTILTNDTTVEVFSIGKKDVTFVTRPSFYIITYKSCSKDTTHWITKRIKKPTYYLLMEAQLLRVIFRL